MNFKYFTITSIYSSFNQPKQREAIGNSVNGLDNYLLFDSTKVFKYYSNFTKNISILSATVGQTITEAFFVTNSSFTHDFLVLLSISGSNYSLKYFRNATVLGQRTLPIFSNIPYLK